MKQTKNKELLQFVYAILLGGFFFIYIAAAGVLVAILISRYCKQHDRLTGCLKPLAALTGGVYLHLMILDHYYVVYYQLHGRFYPMADDLGPFFFMIYLGTVYLLWIPEVLFYIIKRLIHKGKYGF